MRLPALAILLLATAACSAPKSDEASSPPIESLPAEISFDGADAKDVPAILAHGKRLAVVLGCQGCHGDNLQGTNVTEDDPNFGDMNAPNLTLLLADYNDAELERVIRQGVPKDGREFWFMPSESYQFLSDADLAALIAHLRTVKPAGKPMPPIRRGADYEKQVADGIIDSAPKMLPRYRDQAPPDLGQQHARGRRLAQIVCAECHNGGLQGFEGFTPDLTIASAYSVEELETLLTTGKGKSKPDLGLMAEMGRTRFPHMTPSERSAIIAYVKAHADRPQ
jgi:mono/diheme cytochrome c family protein